MYEIKTCEVPAGKYPIGNQMNRESRPEHEVTLKAYAIGLTTVTNAQYTGFIEAGGYQEERFWTPDGWEWAHKGKRQGEPGFWRATQFNEPDQPVVGVCWYEAYAFTRWLADVTGEAWRLPGEAEWEVAARGEYGEAPMPRNYNTAERKIGRTWLVTEAGNTSWCGALDMCGNVWELCQTRWGRNINQMDYGYPYRNDDGREGASGTFIRVMRGGSWSDPLTEADPARREKLLPTVRGNNIGFRLAISR